MAKRKAPENASNQEDPGPSTGVVFSEVEISCQESFYLGCEQLGDRPDLNIQRCTAMIAGQ